jgi:sugar phosphate isomerase/epimerase
MLPLGIYAWFGYGLPLEKRLKLIAEAGFSTTCVWFGDEEEMVSEGRADEMPVLVHDAGLFLENIHAPFWNSNYLWAQSGNEQSIIQTELSNAISFCGKHHIPIMVMHLSAGKNPPPPNQSGLEIIRELLQQADDEGVTIALENAEEYGNSYLEFAFANIQAPNLGFCYDSSHDAIAKIFRGKALEKWGYLLLTTHLSDNHGKNDDHLLPGKGSINWQKVMNQFPKNNYKGTIMLEVDGPEANFTAEDFLEYAFLKAKEIAEALGKQPS